MVGHAKTCLVLAGGYDPDLPENVEHARELEELAARLGVADRVTQRRSVSGDEKVRLLAGLLRASRRTLAYTGAGLGVAAGIRQAAVGSAPAGELRSVDTAAAPTVAHRVLVALRRAAHHGRSGWVADTPKFFLE